MAHRSSAADFVNEFFSVPLVMPPVTSASLSASLLGNSHDPSLNNLLQHDARRRQQHVPSREEELSAATAAMSSMKSYEFSQRPASTDTSFHVSALRQSALHSGPSAQSAADEQLQQMQLNALEEQRRFVQSQLDQLNAQRQSMFQWQRPEGPRLELQRQEEQLQRAHLHLNPATHAPPQSYHELMVPTSTSAPHQAQYLPSTIYTSGAPQGSVSTVYLNQSNQPYLPQQTPVWPPGFSTVASTLPVTVGPAALSPLPKSNPQSSIQPTDTVSPALSLAPSVVSLEPYLAPAAAPVAEVVAPAETKSPKKKEKKSKKKSSATSELESSVVSASLSAALEAQIKQMQLQIQGLSQQLNNASVPVSARSNASESVPELAKAIGSPAHIAPPSVKPAEVPALPVKQPMIQPVMPALPPSAPATPALQLPAPSSATASFVASLNRDPISNTPLSAPSAVHVKSPAPKTMPSPMHRHQELNNSLFNVSSIRPHSLQPISHAELLTSLESATASALEMQELQAQVFQLQQRLAERTAQSTELSTLKQTLTREVAQLRTEVARVPLLQREIDELKDQLARSEAVRATQRQYIMTLDRKVNFLQEENLRSSTQLARLAITAPTEQHEVASEPAKAKTKTASVSTASATTETHVRPHSAVSPSKAASKTKPAPSSILKGTIASSSKVRAASPDRPVRRLSTSASAASLKGSKETWRPW